VPQVDVYLVNHHGLDASNHPALVAALAPQVAVVNNGPTKGAEPRTMDLLLKQVGTLGVFQLHRNVRPDAINTEPARIVNDGETCRGLPLSLRVDPRGDRFWVYVPSRDAHRLYESR